MKKFYKISLITAGILAAVGLVLCLSCGFVGGSVWKHLVTSEPVVSRMKKLSDRIGVSVTFGSGDGIYVGSLSERKTEDGVKLWVNGKAITAGEVSYEVPVRGVENLNVKLGAGSFEIRAKEKGTETIGISFEGTGDFQYSLEEGTLQVGLHEASTQTIFGQNLGECIIEVPQDLSLKNFTVKLGAGEMEIQGICAQDMMLQVGAGQLELDDIQASSLNMKVGAGQAVCEKVSGENVTMEVAMGECLYSGQISNNLDVDCSTGNVEVTIDGSEKDHNYDLNCSMGSITVGSMELSGLGSERVMDYGAESLFGIKCGLGNVTIEFDH